MSPRLRAKVDANHGEIVRALLGAGAMVQSLATLGKGVPDLLCWFRGDLYLLEVKSGLRDRLTPDEATWHATWPGPVAVVRSVEDALRAIGALEGHP